MDKRRRTKHCKIFFISKVSIRNYLSVRKKKLQIKKSETDKRTISIYLILKLFTFIARKIEPQDCQVGVDHTSLQAHLQHFTGEKKNIFDSWV